MRFKSILLLFCFMSLALLGGCRDDSPPPVDIEPQKKVIGTYLEALRDGDKDKLFTTLSSEMIFDYYFEPDSLESIFTAQKNLGKIQKWEFNGEQYVDNINNQAMIDTFVTYPKAQFKLTFDLRKVSGKWQVFNVATSNKKGGMKK